MSATWPSVRLGDVLELQRRWLRPDPEELYVEIGIRSYGRGIFHKQPVSGLSLGDKRVLRIMPGDLVFMNIFAWEGAVAVAGEQDSGTIGSHRFVTMTARAGRVDLLFLQRYFQTAEGRALLLRVSPGSAGRNRTMSIEGLLNEAVALPPLAEQRRIVARLDALAAKVEQAKGLRLAADAESESLGRQCIESLFGNHSYPNQPLGSLLREGSQNGLSPRPTLDDHGTAILRISAATSRADAVVDERDVKFLSLTDPEVRKYRLERGDLLACRFNGNLRFVGRFAIFEGNSGETRVYPDKLIRFRLDRERVDPWYARFALNARSARRVIESWCATTAGNIGISAGNLRTVQIPVPPLEAQLRIVATVNSLFTRVRAGVEQQSSVSQRLDAILPSALDRAFAGAL